jgi:hypothetical protein
MLTRYCLILGVCGALQAQQVVAPTPDQVGSPRGENSGDYNITQSFETGYRWNQVFGNGGEYRSDANYGNGIRLLGSSLTVDSKDGHGHWFDEIVLNTEGLGNDPYESVTLRVQKNGLYRYDMVWRLSDYYNPGLTVAGGLHLADTSRRIQDHDLTLLPQSKLQFHLGYSRNTESGPELSTAQEFDLNGQGYPIFTNVRRQWNEYRVGADANFGGFKLTVLRRWDFYKDDTPATSDGVVAAGPTIGNTDLTVVSQFNRSQPIHGSDPGWMGNLFKRTKYWAVNARVAYNSGHNDFALDESVLGVSQFGGAASRQIVVGGDAKRPDMSDNLSLSFFPTERLTLTNHTSLSSDRIDGASSYSEVLTGTNLGLTLYFQYLGIRTITNSTRLNYRAAKWFGFYGGWNYSDRQVSTTQGETLPAFANSTVNNAYEVTNQIRSGIVGVHMRPLKALSINLDGEMGRATEPLTPIADNKFHTLGGRVDYRLKKLQLSSTYRENYNNNQPISFQYSYSHSRTYSASGSWSPVSWFSIDASYTRLHLDTWSFLAFFAGVGRPTLQASYPSEYLSNIHAGNLGVRFSLGRRADFYAGYSITMDVGDGRASAAPAGTTNPITALLDSVQTFPLTYESPLARLSVKISPKVRWNAGYQFYDYAEQFGLLSYYQNFHAHTGYTSILWAF